MTYSTGSRKPAAYETEYARSGLPSRSIASVLVCRCISRNRKEDFVFAADADQVQAIAHHCSNCLEISVHGGQLPSTTIRGAIPVNVGHVVEAVKVRTIDPLNTKSHRQAERSHD